MWHIPAKLSSAQSRWSVTKNGNIHDCVNLRRDFSSYRLSMYYFLSIYFLSLISESCYHLNLPLTITITLIIFWLDLTEKKKRKFVSTNVNLLGMYKKTRAFFVVECYDKGTYASKKLIKNVITLVFYVNKSSGITGAKQSGHWSNG